MICMFFSVLLSHPHTHTHTHSLSLSCVYVCVLRVSESGFEMNELFLTYDDSLQAEDWTGLNITPIQPLCQPPTTTTTMYYQISISMSTNLSVHMCPHGYLQPTVTIIQALADPSELI